VVPPAFRTVRLQVDDRVAYLTLHRPEVLNSVSVELLDEVVAASAWLATQREVRVVVVAGTGRTFSAGTDLMSLDALRGDPPAARAAASASARAATALERLEAVTVAAIHGRCVGGGLALALACDLRIAGDGARFSLPEVELGLPLAGGALVRLLRDVPPVVVRDLVLSSREFSAPEAAAFGIVSRVVSSDHLDAEVAALADDLATKPHLPVRATLDAVAVATGVGTPVGWGDADTLLAAVRDAEVRATVTRPSGDGSRGRPPARHDPLEDPGPWT
jgi:enoyl-CoA hydratase/carnithine racemase